VYLHHCPHLFYQKHPGEKKRKKLEKKIRVPSVLLSHILIDQDSRPKIPGTPDPVDASSYTAYSSEYR
jgi:hypothetical protein